jgi:flagellar motor switch/type III secretory pathway protein FliN
LEHEIVDKGMEPESIDWPERAKYWFFGHGGTLDPETGKEVFGQKLKRAAERFAYARSTAQSGQWQPKRDKDKLTFALENPEHGGRTRGFGELSWEHAFPLDRDTYRSRQRKKEEEAERLRSLKEQVLQQREEVRQAKEREKALETRLNEEIKRQVQIAVSSLQRSLSELAAVNISPPIQLKSSCVSTKVPIPQDDAGLRFPVDDITAPFTTCELHMQEGNVTFMVATGVVSPIDPTKTPRIHMIVIPLGYASSRWIEL